ncbi:hypothetical protein [Aquimarina rubra]|uniref:Uncharacterized protein n=1 Tax=Aquimarina rubra TaxID=1920033 RepID=A0ABW5LE88_9FLAO
MALDFHRLSNNEYLFGIDDHKNNHLEEIYTEFKNWTGIYVDRYGDTNLTVDHQKLMIKIIDSYIHKTDLNVNKQKTIDIIEFRALMDYFSDKGIDLKMVGD